MRVSTHWSATRWSSCSSGRRQPTALPPVGPVRLAGVLEYEGFVRDVTNAATGSGVAIEQFHPEYGANQFEISLTPQSPIAAADQLLLMRIIVGRVARQYGLRVSLSPVPFAGSVGSGHTNTFHYKRAMHPCSRTAPAHVE